MGILCKSGTIPVAVSFFLKFVYLPQPLFCLSQNGKAVNNEASQKTCQNKLK